MKDVLTVPWARWKTVQAAHPTMTVAHYYSGAARTKASHESVTVLAGNREWIVSTVPEGADETDFENNFESGSEECVDLDDAIASLIADFRSPGLTTAGLQPVTVMDAAEGAEDYIPSWILDAAAGQLGILDVKIAGDLVGPGGVCNMSGGRLELWTEAERGCALHFSVVDRDDKSGAFSAYGLVRTKLLLATGTTSGTFQVGETVTGDTSGASTVILAIGTDELEVEYDGATAFQNGEGITGATSAATATLDTPGVDEGDVLPLRKPFIDDDWLFRASGDPIITQEFHPGGAKPVPAGYYFRTTLYNDGAATVTVKTTLTLATE